jgi:hypothetical protein
MLNYIDIIINLFTFAFRKMENLENPKQSRGKNNFNIMKKVLFVLGAIGAMSLVACNGTKDCACDIYDADGLVWVTSTEAGVNGTLDVLEFDGECEDATWKDLPTDNDKHWAELATDFTLKCKEK